MINEFKGEYRFLSNFYPCTVKVAGVEFPTVEHAYQACKALYKEDFLAIANLSSPSEAKIYGRKMVGRPDWLDIRVEFMTRLLRQKFKQEYFKAKLIATKDEELIEGNTWGDRFWGKCNGYGFNVLGITLMKVRDEIKGVTHPLTPIRGKGEYNA